jgi:hypothetical protein
MGQAWSGRILGPSVTVLGVTLKEARLFLVGDWAPGLKRVEVALGPNVVLTNLEGPVLPSEHTVVPAPKVGPSLFSPELPRGPGQFILSLANNHVMDYGAQGLNATMAALALEGIRACGAGKNATEARRPMVVEDRGVKVGVIACCEAQFGVARRTEAGVAEFGPWVYDTIRELHRAVDSVVVSIHIAVEDAPWPSPYARELCRSFISAGASVVHGHHAHVPQGYEQYREGLIFYGMGNFAVDSDKWRDYPNGLWSLAADLDFAARPVRWRPYTLEICTGGEPGTVTVGESSAKKSAGHKRYLEMCNRPFEDDALFDALWQEVALRVYLHHGARYMGFAAPDRRGRRASLKASLSSARDVLVGSAIIQPPSRQDLQMWYHLIACESHRQMLATALGVLSGEVDDLRSDETRQLADEMMPWSTRIGLP